MKRLIGVVTLLALSAFSVAADEPPAIPKAPAPVLLTAQVTGKDRDQVTFTKYSFGANQVEKDGKKVWEYKTYSISSPPKPVGKDVRAFGVDGKPIEPAVLAKLLAKPVTVLVYYADANRPGAPDPFYLQPFKDGTVAFVVSCDLFEEPGSPQPKPATPQATK